MKNIKTALFLSLILLSNAMFCQLNQYIGHEAYDDNDKFECKCKIDSKLPEFIFTLFLDTESHGVSRIEIKHSDNKKNIQTLTIHPGFIKSFYSRDFDTLDINFDGYPDISLLYETPSGGGLYCVWLYNPKRGKFKYDQDFSEMGDCQLDPKTKTIISVSQNGMSYGSKFYYKVTGNKPFLFREEDSDYNEQTKCVIVTTNYYSHKKIISTKTDTLRDKVK